MRLFIASAIATMLTATAAQAEQWHVVSERTEEAPRALMYVDQDSIKRSGNSATASVMTVLEPGGLQGARWTVSVINREVDCKAMRTRQLQSKYYEGTKLLAEETKPTEWASIGNGSMVEGVANAMCGNPDYHTGKITDPRNFAFELFNLLPI